MILHPAFLVSSFFLLLFFVFFMGVGDEGAGDEGVLEVRDASFFKIRTLQFYTLIPFHSLWNRRKVYQIVPNN